MTECPTVGGDGTVPRTLHGRARLVLHVDFQSHHGTLRVLISVRSISAWRIWLHPRAEGRRRGSRSQKRRIGRSSALATSLGDPSETWLVGPPVKLVEEPAANLVGGSTGSGKPGWGVRWKPGRWGVRWKPCGWGVGCSVTAQLNSTQRQLTLSTHTDVELSCVS